MAGPDDKPPATIWASPEGVAVLAAAGATAVVAAMPLVLVPGVVAYGILTWLRAERWKESRAESARAPVEPPLEGLTAPNAGRIVAAVNVQRHILHEIATSVPEHRALLEASAGRVRELVGATASLVRGLQRIEALLRVEDARGGEAIDLERRAKQATDPAAKAGYARALEQQRAKTAALTELRGRAQRYDAQLRAIQLALETTAAQVVRIKSAEGAAATAESERVADALSSLAIDVESLAETLDETQDETSRYVDTKGAPR